MAIIRKNITISQAALDQANALKAVAYSTTRSGVINRAVNEAWERRFSKPTEQPKPKHPTPSAPTIRGGPKPKKSRRAEDERS